MIHVAYKRENIVGNETRGELSNSATKSVDKQIAGRIMAVIDETIGIE